MQEIYTKHNLGKRVGATIVDRALFFLILLVGYFFMVNLGKDHPALYYLLVPFSIGFWFLYYPFMEFKFGATLGHSLFNLKVYSLSGKAPSLVQCLKRRVADIADYSLYGVVGIIIITQTKHHQRAGDYWAKTYVVDLKDPMQMEYIKNAQEEWVF